MNEVPKVTETPMGDGRKLVRAVVHVNLDGQIYELVAQLLVSEKIDLVADLTRQEDGTARLALVLGGVPYAVTVQAPPRVGGDAADDAEIEEQPYWWDE